MQIPLSKFLGEKKKFIIGDNVSITNDLYSGYNQHHTEASKIMLGLSKEQILQLMGLVYTYKQHEKKILDSTLMIDIADALIAKEHEIIVRKEGL